MKTGWVVLLVCLALPAAAAGPDAAAARAVLDGWVAAQNGGRFADYQALYSPGFRGVRRSGQKAVELDRDGWLKDRQRMFKRPMKVGVEEVKAEERADGVHFTFTQSFSSGSYADVGEKELVVAAVDGHPLIVREELRSSRRVAAAAGEAACDTMACGRATAEGKQAIIAACAKDCEAGDAGGCRDRATIYSGSSCGGEADPKQAAIFYARSCDLGETLACLSGAGLLEATDPARAAALYEKACKPEDDLGCYGLALLLREGKGVPVDVKRAIELMDVQCRENGRSPQGTNSCDQLRDMYKNGKFGVKKDRSLAREYQELYKNATSGE